MRSGRLAQDLRYALRAFRRSPGFAAVAILSLALGIGANTAIFSLIDAVLLKTLTVRHPEQLVQVELDGNQEYFTNPMWEQLRDRQDVFAGIFASGGHDFNLARGGEERRVTGSYISGDYFTTLGIPTMMGRVLNRDDDRRGCPGAAVLSYDFWQREYGAHPDAITRSISLDNHEFPIVGVLAPGFRGTVVGTGEDVFLPICAEPIVQAESSTLHDRRWSWLRVIGRPRPEVSIAQVRARLKTLAPAVFEDTLPEDWGPDAKARYLRQSLETRPASTGFSDLREKYRPALLTLMAVVALVLLIACANVANLLLARATARRKEIAVRLALGAGRARIVRQLLTDSLLLSSAGAALGVLLARWGAALMVHLLSTGSSAVFLDLTLDPRVLGFTIAVAAGTGLAFGLAPAWQATRVKAHTAMKDTSRAATQSRAAMTAGNSLVIAQVALSMVLVAGAGLLVGTFRRLETVDPGFDRRNVLLMRTDFSHAKYSKEHRVEEYRELMRRLRAVAGVGSVSASNLLPVSGVRWTNQIRVEGDTGAAPQDSWVFINQVTSGYFETMGTRLLAGRDFNDHDRPGAPKVAIVNEALARKFFGSANVVGRVFRKVGMSEQPDTPMQIVGVVRDSKYLDLRESPAPVLYQPMGQDIEPLNLTYFELRADGPATRLIPAVKSAMAQFDPDVAMSFETLSAQLDESLTRERLLATLSGFFGVLALLLSAIGLYGVMSYRVARRRNEIGIRMALGAGQRRILAMVLCDVAVLLGFGLAAGIGAALAATRLIESFLYGVTARDPAVLATGSAILAIVAASAGFLPARRASRLDPMSALREE